MYKRKRVDPRVIGFFVIGAIILGVAGLIFFGPGGLLSKTEQYVLHFEGSVKGLNVGSPVRFRGVKIGQVKEINVLINPSEFKFRIPVIIEIETSRIGADGSHQELLTALKSSLKDKDPIEALVEKGLRARLEMDSLVTGQLYVNFDMFPNSPIELTGYPSAYMELPTIRSSLGELTKTFEDLPLRELADKMVNAAMAFEKLITAPSLHNGLEKFDETASELNSLLKNLNEQVVPLSQTMQDTLKETRQLVKNIDNKVVPLTDNFVDTKRRLDSALSKFSSASERTEETMRRWKDLAANDSMLQRELSQTMQEVSKAARSVRYLTNELERDPQLILRGRVEGGQQ